MLVAATSRIGGSRILILTILVLAFFPAKMPAQGETTSAIVGQVSDVTGGAIPGATVTAHHAETGLQRTAITHDSGRFSLTQVKPVTITVRVEAQGFEAATKWVRGFRTGARKQTVDFVLRIAHANEKIEVSSEAAILSPERREYFHHPQRARPGKPSDSGRGPDFPPSICHWGPGEHRGQWK